LATTQKALELAAYLAEEFKLRFPTKTITESFDTDGSPLVAVDDGTPAAGEQSVLVKVRPVEWSLAKDVLGNTATIFTPHVIQIATEASATANVSIVTVLNLLPVLMACTLKGTKVEFYLETNTTAPSASTFAASKLKVAFYPHAQYPMVNDQ
jgi:hypothetical protein